MTKKLLTFVEAERRLCAGNPVHWRRCTVCNGAITFELPFNGKKPRMISCKCRSREASNLVDLTWDELRAIIEG